MADWEAVVVVAVAVGWEVGGDRGSTHVGRPPAEAHNKLWVDGSCAWPHLCGEVAVGVHRLGPHVHAHVAALERRAGLRELAGEGGRSRRAWERGGAGGQEGGRQDAGAAQM